VLNIAVTKFRRFEIARGLDEVPVGWNRCSRHGASCIFYRQHRAFTTRSVSRN